ncbi:unnamed protein product [Rotaria magnacalcarata]|uniref:Uncharacterized protein n=1 Tax=Rotaria magnacalcarata TaxID=392030 RepID=A0A816R195_9BILA|nr:unnamed protein product [Rotaria magnacalcarata]
MTQLKGSFVVTRDIKENENIHVFNVRARALSLTNPTRPEIIAIFKRIKSSVIDGIHLSKSLLNNYEEDNDVSQFQTTTKTLFPDDLYDSDLDEDDNGPQQSQITLQTSFQDDFYESDLDDDEDSKRSNNHTPKALYLSNCKKNGVVPLSTIINIIDTSSPCIDIRDAAMTPLDVKVLIPSLKMSTTVTKLDLGGNGFGSMGAIYLANLIKENGNILELDLSYNDIGLTGCEALCNALRSCRRINILILDGNRLDDKCAPHLADLLASHKYFLHVSLFKNLFESISTARSLSAALSDNQSIEHLNISFNHFQQKATGIFVNFLSTNFRLRSLNLSFSSFGIDASKAFSLAMKTKTSHLEELDLSSNLIDDECAKYLANVLSTNESLKTLNLMKNPLSPTGCYTMLKPLQTMPTSQLEIIDIRDIYIKSQAFISLANDLEDRFPKLVIKRGDKSI